MPREPSARAHQKALAATVKLIGERGIDGLSMDRVAEQSGVSKATLYNHWESKEALCLEAVCSLHGELPAHGAQDGRRGLVLLLQHFLDARKSRKLARIMPKVIGYASNNPAFLNAWRSRVEAPRHLRLRQWMEQAVAAGELRPDIDFEFAAILLLGPVMYSKMMRSERPERLPERLVDSVYRLYAPPDRSGENLKAVPVPGPAPEVSPPL